MTSNQPGLGFRGGDDDPQVEGSSNSNFNNKFDKDKSRIAEIQSKISVEDFDYLKGFANSNKRIDENDPRLVEIGAKISEEDIDYLKGLANKRHAKKNGRQRIFDNNVGTISLCVIL